MLVVLDHQIAQIGIGGGDGQVFADEVGGKQIPGRAFMGDTEIAGLGAQFGADREVAVEQIGSRTFELGGIVVMLVAAEAQDAELVGLGFAQGDIDQQALRQEQFAGGDIVIGSDTALAAYRRDDRAAIIFLVLQSDGDLRQPAVLVVDGIA